MSFFTPFQNLPVNPLVLSDVLGVFNSEQMEQQSSVSREAKLKASRQHGFNVTIVSSAFTKKQLAGFLRDVLWGGDWSLETVNFDGPCIFVTKSARLTDTCNKVGVGWLAKRGFENLVFWDSANKRNLSLELVMLELAIHETMDSYAVDSYFSPAAANIAYIERQIAADALSLARVTGLPSLANDESVSISAEVSTDSVRVLLSYAGENRSYFYRVNVAEGYMRCEGLKHYQGHIPGWSYTHPLQKR